MSRHYAESLVGNVAAGRLPSILERLVNYMGKKESGTLAQGGERHLYDV
jgi:hypothetical protein